MDRTGTVEPAQQRFGPWQKESGRLTVASLLAFSTAVTALQIILFAAALSGYLAEYRLTVLGSMFIALFLALFAVSAIASRISLPLRMLVLACIAGAVTLVWQVPIEQDGLTATPMGDTREISVEAKDVREWNEIHAAFFLHPHYDEEKPLEEIRLPVPAGATAVNIDASKPRASVIGPKGAFLGDGVELVVSAHSQEGDVRSIARIFLSPHRVSVRGWERFTFPLTPGDGDITIKVTKGPPGSNTLFDSTLVSASFATHGPQALLGHNFFGIVILGLLLLTANFCAGIPQLRSALAVVLTGLWSEWLEFIKQNFALLSWLAVATVLAYGFAATTYSLSVDEELSLVGDRTSDWLVNGRYGVAFLKTFLLNTIPLPFLNVTIAAVLRAVSALAWCLTFDRAANGRLTGTPYLAFFAVFYATLPSNVYYMTFNVNNEEISFACLLTAIGCRLAWQWAFESRSYAALFLSFSMFFFAASIYQSFIVMAGAGLTIMYALHLTLPALSPTSSRYANGLLLLCPLLLALLLYSAIFHAMPQSDYVVQFIGWGASEPTVIARSLVEHVAKVLSGTDFLGGQVVTLAFAAGCVILSGLVIRAFTRREFLPPLLFLLVLVSPFLFSISLGSVVPTRAQQVLPLAYGSIALFVVAATQLTRKLRWAFVAVTALVLIWNSRADTLLFLSKQLAYQTDVELSRAIALQLDDQGWDGGPISFVVVGAQDLRPDNRFYIINDSIGSSFFTWEDGSRAIPFMQVMGHQVHWPPKEQRRRVPSIAASMPTWPAKGSVKLEDGLAVVKLGEVTGAQLKSFAAAD